MNREIKFRAWDKTLNQMNYKVLVGNTDYNDENYTCNAIWVEDSKRWVNADGNCIDLMQFTGKKDKEGKEIYEGDVVVLREANRKYVVKFNNAAFKLFHADPKINDMEWGNLSRVDELLWEINVIGDIYTNPELLDEPQH